mmetsp:Transcript_83806/g.242023  ORF Transcript_83806/g.242023 Transcript_83806/m.242023 type:complete len:121 (-) Transcript_83806:124-486(-)
MQVRGPLGGLEVPLGARIRPPRDGDVAVRVAGGVLEKSVGEFLTWRAGVAACSENQRLREQQRSRFNVVSVDEDDSLFELAKRLLASKLQRIFLSSEELARIVGIVSSRDILIEVLDSLL